MVAAVYIATVITPGNIVAAQDAKHSAQDGADHQRLAEDAELFLDALGVSLQLVQAGDVVVNFVQQVSQRCPADAVGGGEGNAGQAELFLNDRLGPVGQLEGNVAQIAPQIRPMMALPEA